MLGDASSPSPERPWNQKNHYRELPPATRHCLVICSKETRFAADILLYCAERRPLQQPLCRWLVQSGLLSPETVNLASLLRRPSAAASFVPTTNRRTSVGLRSNSSQTKSMAAITADIDADRFRLSLEATVDAPSNPTHLLTDGGGVEVCVLTSATTKSLETYVNQLRRRSQQSTVKHHQWHFIGPMMPFKDDDLLIGLSDGSAMLQSALRRVCCEPLTGHSLLRSASGAGGAVEGGNGGTVTHLADAKGQEERTADIDFSRSGMYYDAVAERFGPANLDGYPDQVAARVGPGQRGGSASPIKGGSSSSPRLSSRSSTVTTQTDRSTTISIAARAPMEAKRRLEQQQRSQLATAKTASGSEASNAKYHCGPGMRQDEVRGRLDLRAKQEQAMTSFLKIAMNSDPKEGLMNFVFHMTERIDPDLGWCEVAAAAGVTPLEYQQAVLKQLRLLCRQGIRISPAIFTADEDLNKCRARVALTLEECRSEDQVLAVLQRRWRGYISEAARNRILSLSASTAEGSYALPDASASWTSAFAQSAPWSGGATTKMSIRASFFKATSTCLLETRQGIVLVNGGDAHGFTKFIWPYLKSRMHLVKLVIATDSDQEYCGGLLLLYRHIHRQRAKGVDLPVPRLLAENLGAQSGAPTRSPSPVGIIHHQELVAIAEDMGCLGTLQKTKSMTESVPISTLKRGAASKAECLGAPVDAELSAAGIRFVKFAPTQYPRFSLSLIAYHRGTDSKMLFSTNPNLVETTSALPPERVPRPFDICQIPGSHTNRLNDVNPTGSYNEEENELQQTTPPPPPSAIYVPVGECELSMAERYSASTLNSAVYRIHPTADDGYALSGSYESSPPVQAQTASSSPNGNGHQVSLELNLKKTETATATSERSARRRARKEMSETATQMEQTLVKEPLVLPIVESLTGTEAGLSFCLMCATESDPATHFEPTFIPPRPKAKTEAGRNSLLNDASPASSPPRGGNSTPRGRRSVTPRTNRSTPRRDVVPCDLNGTAFEASTTTQPPPPTRFDDPTPVHTFRLGMASASPGSPFHRTDEDERTE